MSFYARRSRASWRDVSKPELGNEIAKSPDFPSPVNPLCDGREPTESGTLGAVARGSKLSLAGHVGLPISEKSAAFAQCVWHLFGSVNRFRG